MEVFKFFDAYSLRARLFPAIIAAAPALAALTLLISWKTLDISNLFASLGALVLLFAIADLSRALGRKVEKNLYEQYGAMPSISMFRRNDETIDEGSKGRYRKFISERLNTIAPSPELESEDQDEADRFYNQCCVWLRQKTRDTTRFHILFGENIIYGFRRNLLGVKTLALWLNFIVVALCGLILWRMSWDIGTPLGSKVLFILLVSFTHAIYMTFAVTRSNVWDASRAYARELILSCEVFISDRDRASSSPS